MRYTSDDLQAEFYLDKLDEGLSRYSYLIFIIDPHLNEKLRQNTSSLFPLLRPRPRPRLFPHFTANSLEIFDSTASVMARELCPDDPDIDGW